MAYGHGQTIDAAHLNTLVASTNGMWATGTGDRGYGQTAISTAATGNISGHGYSSLRAALATICSWQDTATTLLPSSAAVTKPSVVTAFPTGATPSLPDIVSLVDTNRLNFQSGNMTLTSSAASTTRSTPWGFTGPNLVVDSGMSVSGANGAITATKTGGATNGWDVGFRSTELFSTCHVQFKANQNTSPIMVGFSRNPAANPSYETIEFATYCAWGGPGLPGNALVYESGSNTDDFGSYTSSTVFAMTYDGSYVRYYKDGVLKRTVAATGLMGLDTSFYEVGGSINSLEFGPGTTLGTLPDFIQCGFSIEYASEDAARYFFNTGGELRLAFAHPDTSTSQDSNWNATLDNLNLAFRCHSTAKLSGNGTSSGSIGYYELTTDWQVIHTVSGSSAYSSNIMNVYARAVSITGANGAKGSHIQLYANFYDYHDNNYFDAVSSGTTCALSHLRAAAVLPTLPAAPTCSIASSFG